MMSWAATRHCAESCASVASAMCWACPAPPRCATWKHHHPSTQGVAVAPRPPGNRSPIGASHSVRRPGGASRCETGRKDRCKSRWSCAGYRHGLRAKARDPRSGWWSLGSPSRTSAWWSPVPLAMPPIKTPGIATSITSHRHRVRGGASGAVSGRTGAGHQSGRLHRSELQTGQERSGHG
jgi:hypothetical protein